MFGGMLDWTEEQQLRHDAKEMLISASMQQHPNGLQERQDSNRKHHPVLSCANQAPKLRQWTVCARLKAP